MAEEKIVELIRAAAILTDEIEREIKFSPTGHNIQNILALQSILKDLNTQAALLIAERDDLSNRIDDLVDEIK